MIEINETVPPHPLRVLLDNTAANTEAAIDGGVYCDLTTLHLSEPYNPETTVSLLLEHTLKETVSLLLAHTLKEVGDYYDRN